MISVSFTLILLREIYHIASRGILRNAKIVLFDPVKSYPNKIALFDLISVRLKLWTSENIVICTSAALSWMYSQEQSAKHVRSFSCFHRTCHDWLFLHWVHFVACFLQCGRVLRFFCLAYTAQFELEQLPLHTVRVKASKFCARKIRKIYKHAN